MPSFSVGPRRLIPAALVLVLVGVLYLFARLPQASEEDRAAMAAPFRFTQRPIALPVGLPLATVREVNPEYEQIRAWISSVGAAIAVNDLDGGGTANDLCLVDSRSDAVIVTPVPDSGQRYQPFVLDPAPLPVSSAMAPMGCVPGDFNGDGWIDVLVYYWGRTPVLFMHQPGVRQLSQAAFHPIELVPQASTTDRTYRGQLWNTNAVAVADFDGDGSPDIGVFNYFPDSEVLDPHGQRGVQMNHSMSRAENGGGAHVLRFVSATTGRNPSVSYEEQPALDLAVATGWTLGAASADLDGDFLPELYLANDFGRDHLVHNVSTPGAIRFESVEGERDAFTPKSLVLGHDSFKGMGAEFGDLRSAGKFDVFVSNITTEWGLEESNFVWCNIAGSPAEARSLMRKGIAPFEDAASKTNLAWVGWGWDAKMGDFDNSGRQAIVQTAGFVKGDTNRWAWLQELAMTNDLMLREPRMWPNLTLGADVAGNQPFAFWVPESNGRFVNLSPELGFDNSTPSRGVAVADTDGDGGLDFAIARQWGAPEYYRNDNAGRGNFLGLRLLRPVAGKDAGAPIGSPAYGAVARVTTADGRTQLAQLDGGGGHSGKRSFDIYFGLGNQGAQPVSVELSWRDNGGSVHAKTFELRAGWHTLVLTDDVQEVRP